MATSYRGGGYVGYIPSEYFGLGGLAEALKETGAILKEQKRYEEEKEEREEDRNRQWALQQINFLKGIGADQKTLTTAARDIGLIGDQPIDLEFDPERWKNEQLEAFTKLTPEERELPENQWLADQYYNYYYGDVVPPSLRRQIAEVELETKELQRDAASRQDILDRAFMADYESRDEAANALLESFPGVPEDLKGGGQNALNYWLETSEGIKSLTLLDEQIRGAYVRTRKDRIAADAMQAELDAASSGWTGPMGELMKDQAKLLAEETRAYLGERTPSVIMNYMEGRLENLSEGDIAIIRAAERRMQAVADAHVEKMFREAEADGNETADLLKLLVSIGEDNPNFRKEFGDVINGLFYNLLNEYAPEAAAYVNKSKNWLEGTPMGALWDKVTGGGGEAPTGPVPLEDMDIDINLEKLTALEPGLLQHSLFNYLTEEELEALRPTEEEPIAEAGDHTIFLEGTEGDVDEAIRLVDLNIEHQTELGNDEAVANLNEARAALESMRASAPPSDEEEEEKVTEVSEAEREGLSGKSKEELQSLYDSISSMRDDIDRELEQIYTEGTASWSYILKLRSQKKELTKRLVEIKREELFRR